MGHRQQEGGHHDHHTAPQYRPRNPMVAMLRSDGVFENGAGRLRPRHVIASLVRAAFPRTFTQYSSRTSSSMGTGRYPYNPSSPFFFGPEIQNNSPVSSSM